MSKIGESQTEEEAQLSFIDLGGYLLKNACNLTSLNNGHYYDDAVAAEKKYLKKYAKSQEINAKKNVDYVNSKLFCSLILFF